MGQESDLLTPDEVAERLRIDVETVQNLARKGVLPSVPLPSSGTGKKVTRRFRREVIEAIARGEDVAALSSTATGEKGQR